MYRAMLLQHQSVLIGVIPVMENLIVSMEVMNEIVKRQLITNSMIMMNIDVIMVNVSPKHLQMILSLITNVLIVLMSLTLSFSLVFMLVHLHYRLKMLSVYGVQNDQDIMFS